MGLKVCKFGGSSLAEAGAIEGVCQIITSDKERRYIVVSAPGKRNAADIKITDALYACSRHAEQYGSCNEPFKLVRDRFTQIAADLELTLDIDGILDEVQKSICEIKSPDFAASRGEYLNARIMADKLNFAFIDAADIVRFDSRGAFDSERTNDLAAAALEKVERAVIPGFYGRDNDGNIKTFSRGGSDISGAIIARAANASVYENWTDVSGFLACDPRIVENPKRIKVMSYKELRELSYMGATVLHSESIFPVRRGKIPVNIKNTFKPEDEGTLILPSADYEKFKKPGTITGIAGKKDFSIIYIEKTNMNAELGFARRVLSVFESHGVSIEHMPTGIDTLCVIVHSSGLENGMRQLIIDDINKQVSPRYIKVHDNLALVATVGHGMAETVGTASKLFTALAKKNINVRVIDQGSSELNIIVGVSNSDYEESIRAIYEAFIA